jgi:glycyl-tRNA synthetase
MNETVHFQSIIMKLQAFWGERGCMIWQPYYTQVGAGTMNPATFLRVLGPEPWHVAYVEPSIRPDDARYGDNPNRLQQFYQFQVILKPDPGNPQELYLESLQAVGIDPAKHDIRFVEDNWQQPAIGAWGLGWEVWLDGVEITQFTYFQQCGGIDLDPVSVEITYGLERIAMTLQGVRHFKDIQWNPERTFGDVNLMGEREHSAYYFEVADVDSMRKMYDLFEHEAERAIDAGLVLPAHDYVLKTSHTFNVLDTRGAVGVTERQALFARTRDLARRVAEAYLDQRQLAEFPWMDEATVKPAEAVGETGAEIQAEAAPFLLEIGTEELPAADLTSAIAQLETSIPAMLGDLRLAHGAVRVMGTPRRLVVLVEDLAARQPDLDLIIKGPPAERAFDADGNPTRAAEGFARSKGIEVAQLKVEEIEGGEYVVAHVREQGEPAYQVFREALADLVAGLRFTKSMRWNESGVSFSRPIRWLLALHGTTVVPFSYAGYTSSRVTRGLRFAAQAEFSVESPQDFLEKMAAQGIILDPQVREAEIRTQAGALADEIGGKVQEDPDLILEVTQMVEQPHALRGEFDPAFLQALPPEVLTSVMKKHQRYFVLEDAQGKLMPYFIAISNGIEKHLDIVTDGNQQVVLARFDDAKFFIQKDLEQPLASFVEALNTLTFQVKLGSLLDKTNRLTDLVQPLGERLGLTASELETTRRAALLAKADLATNMVVEMTSLQGVMGRYYALHSGESPEVAEAIFEHYLPRYADDVQPRTKPGLVVGLADRLDSLMGLFAVGLPPSGTKDPFAQRRAALGICQNLIAWQNPFDLCWGLEAAAQRLPVDVADDDLAACLDFIQRRLRVMLLEMGHPYDVVDAILAEKGSDPYSTLLGVEALKTWVSRDDWGTILPAFSRCVRIIRDLDQHFSVDPASFETESEQKLFAALSQAEDVMGGSDAVDDLLTAVSALVPIINQFFDEVLVMAEDAAIRQNRLGLMQRIAGLAAGVADLSYLEGF